MNINSTFDGYIVIRCNMYILLELLMCHNILLFIYAKFWCFDWAMSRICLFIYTKVWCSGGGAFCDFDLSRTCLWTVGGLFDFDFDVWCSGALCSFAWSSISIFLVISFLSFWQFHFLHGRIGLFGLWILILGSTAVGWIWSYEHKIFSIYVYVFMNIWG